MSSKHFFGAETRREAVHVMAACLMLAFCLCAQADVPDFTSSLEFVANPAKERWPSNEKARGVLDLQFYRGLLFSGSGEVETNPGPCPIYSIDPVKLSMKNEYSAGTEAIALFRIGSWGDLIVPSQDLREGDKNKGHVFLRNSSGTWTKRNGVAGEVPTSASSTVAAGTHIWDIAEYGGRVWAAGYDLCWSTNKCKNFTMSGSVTNANRVFYYFNGSDQRGKYELRRQMHFLRFKDRFFAVPNAPVQPNYQVSDSNQYYNKLELFTYNSSTKKFDESRIPASSLFPDISRNDFKLAVSSVPMNTYTQILVRIWHPTPFKDRVLYVGSYDTPNRGDTIMWTSYPLPIMGCSAYLKGTEKTLAADRISFGGDKEEYPWDFEVVGDTCYALTSKPNASTKVFRHSVWKSTDGVSFTRVLTFDFHQNMISLDYRDGWFWFGAGVKRATEGYAYDSQPDESGAIYRVRCPMEPTSVVAAGAPAEIHRGVAALVPFRLSAQPATNLTLVVASNPSQNVSLDKTSLTFTPSNWQEPQYVSVSLADGFSVTGTPRVIVTCGANSNDSKRGKYVSPEVTSAPVFLTPVETVIPPISFRDASEGGGVTLGAAGGAGGAGGAGAGGGSALSVHLVDCGQTLWYAPFTNGTLKGVFYASQNGVHPGADGRLTLSVDADSPSKFMTIGVSTTPIHVGDMCTPGGE